MKQHSTLVIMGLVLMMACRSEHEAETIAPDRQFFIPVQQLQEDLLKMLKENNEIRWEWTTSQQVASALVQNDSILTVGYQPEGFKDLDVRIHEIDLHTTEWESARASILEEIQLVYDVLGLEKDARNQVTLVHNTLPYFKIKMAEPEVIERLRSLGTVRYVEPATFMLHTDVSGAPEHRISSSSGCDVEPAASIPTSDYVTVAPGGKVPWNFYHHNIPAAWQQSTGDNITVGLIDTGISPDQAKLNSQFSSGYSPGRTREKYGTYVSSIWWWADPDGPDDQCGHGTQMAGALAAPRTADGTSIGVAYQANLIAFRASGDVIINSSNEKDGVSDAMVYLGNRNDVKVISMSMGDVFSSGQVADAVRYAYGKGKLLMCAAGTSLTWTSWWGVIFPANMSETVAITGIQDSGYTKCTTCHDGSAVDFVIVMQQAATERTSLTLALSGNQPAYVGGSSVATATSAGIAALVWATNPGQTREQVMDRLKNASDFYPARDGNFGWGKIDAAAAVN